MGKKILITGAGGFIGGFIVDKALERGFDTFAGVRSSTNREYLKDGQIKFVNLTFKSREKLRGEISAFKAEHGKWDYIVHNLGLTKSPDRHDFDKVNFEYLRNFVEALIDTDCVPEKFIYMSSLSAWGGTSEEGTAPIRPTDSPCPDTAYGRSKLRAEFFLRSCNGFPFVVLRPTGVYGPREKDYFMMMDLIKKGIDFSIGAKRKKLTFIYVKDLVRAIFLAIERGNPGEGYFLTDGNVYSQKDFRKITARLLGKRFVLSVPVPLTLCRFVCERAEDIAKVKGKSSTLNRDKFNILKQQNWSCDISKAEHDLGFFAEYDLEKGVSESIAWYRENGWL